MRLRTFQGRRCGDILQTLPARVRTNFANLIRKFISAENLQITAQSFAFNKEDAVELLLYEIKGLVKEIETLCGNRVLFTTITTSVEHMRHKREAKEDEK